MRGTERITQSTLSPNRRLADDPLKGLLRDKGAVDAERHIQIIQRKMTRVQQAMVRLVDAQRASAKTARCDCMDLYLATNKTAEIVQMDKTHKMAEALIFKDVKAPCVLEWRAKNSFAQKHHLHSSCRLHPFDAQHKTHVLVRDYVQQSSPGFYKVLAAYETARLTLNFSLKALRKIALDLHKLRAETEGLAIDSFDKDTARLSRKLISDIDNSGELTWILQGLYFEM